MVSKSLLIILSIILIYFIFKSNTETKKSSMLVMCDENIDDKCKMYNSRDINSKCTSMCILKYQTSFNGNHIVKDKNHTCECNLENYSNIDSDTSFLPSTIPDDKLFSNRNYVQSQEESRYNKLIFG